MFSSKFTAILLLAVAAVSSATPLAKRGDATCTFSVSGFNFPTTEPPVPATPSVAAEWKTFVGEMFSESAPPESVVVGETTITGPAGSTGNIYEVITTVGAPSVTDDEAKTIVTGWAPRTIFSEPGSGDNMRWHIDSVSCA
ncbi:hypothetical protein DFP72DRAFT_1173184 [Ephemerocybe angulata]|uniref:Uncharacterized protein n=1 Tax=Ephemerocybe angulata TaxID=980116 RepID=A0A8H6M352_9AGAR|nr:hypothetical protein DFP72DRAFT_1173184 [Tulosesus angulatus]